MNPSPRRVQVSLAALLAVALLGVLGLTVGSVAGWKHTPDSIASDLAAAGDRLEAAASSLQAALQAGANPDRALADAKEAHGAANATAVASLAHLRQLQAVDRSGLDFAPALAAVQQGADTLAHNAHAYDAGQDRVQAMSATHGMARELEAAAAKVAALAPPDANVLDKLTDALFGPLVIPFEILGILLTAAMIGALVIARPLTVHGSEETSLVHPNLAATVPDTAPAVDALPTDAPAPAATEVQA